MERRSLFQKIFGTEQSKVVGNELKLLNGYTSRFTNYDGNLYDSAQIRICIDAIARNGAKLSPKHIRSTTRKFETLDGRIHHLLSEQPNEIDNAYQFYYKLISQLFLHNNAFVYIRRDSNNVPEGLYVLQYQNYKLLEYKDDIFVQFGFRNGKKYTASLKDEVIHLKRFYCESDIVGGSNDAIIRTMSIQHIIREGIINAIKTTQSIKGVLKTEKAMLKPEDIKATRDRFVADFIASSNDSSIASLDSTTSFTPISMNPQTASDSQIDMINDEIMNYFGVNKKIINSSYSEDEWNAFYEGTIEPIALQMGIEFTNKLFTLTEKYFGNKIIFESNRLQYASNSTKIKLARYMNNYLTINEIRDIFNLAPVEDGDKFAVDVNHSIESLEEGEETNE